VKHRILVAEDNPLNSELLRDWLEAEGYEALVATDLDAAFAAVKTQQSNALVLDIQLGSADGLTLVCWMREQSVARQIPVIAVTAQAMASDRQRILESGCDGVVSKPVDLKLLREQLQLCLSRAAALQENQVPGKK
jgi:two-component system, cell cycle response regulator DivK